MTSRIKLPFALRIARREYQIGDEIDAADLTEKQIALVNRVMSLSNSYPVVAVLAPAPTEPVKEAATEPEQTQSPTSKKPAFFKSFFGSRK
jgi:hypothetical protein